MAPVVHGLEVEYSGRVNFVYLDIDDPGVDPFKEDLGYRVQPHFFLLNAEGEVISQWLGRVSAEEFRTVFDAELSK